MGANTAKERAAAGAMPHIMAECIAAQVARYCTLGRDERDNGPVIEQTLKDGQRADTHRSPSHACRPSGGTSQLRYVTVE